MRKVVIDGSGVPYHEEARRGSQILGRLYYGDEVVGYPAEGVFYAIGRPGEGHLGYVRSKFIRVEGLADSEAAEEPSDSDAAERPAGSDDAEAEQPESKPAEQQMAVLEEPAAAPRFERKDPTIGTILSLLISGGGQFYAGETGKGGAILLTSALAPTLGYAASMSDAEQGELNLVPLYVGAAAGVTAWFYGLVSASGDVRERNARVQRLAGQRVEIAPAATQVAGETSYGMQLTMQF